MNRFGQPNYVKDTCMLDDFVFLVAGMGIGAFVPYSGVIFFVSVAAGIYWLYLKYYRYLDYRRNYHD